MDRKYLLTYSYTGEDRKTSFGYNWYEDEEEMMEHIEELKVTRFEFETNEAIEILGSREIEIEQEEI